MKVVVVVGGVGGARFLLGVKRLLGLPPVGPADSPHEVTAVVNTADDIWLHGLRICPDLDTCMYTLGGGIDTERGWGRTGESWTVKEELAAYGTDAEWFGLGDKDIATHLVRTRMMRAGYDLSDITAALCDRWKPGVRLLPMTDDRVETHVVIDEPGTGERKAVHFQEWWIRHRAEPRAQSIVPVGADEATPGPGVLEAIGEADLVLLAPSNPVVSIGSVLAVPGLRGALRKTGAPVVGVSPIIGDKPVRGMADACLAAIGLETSAQAVGRHYGSRACSDKGILDGWLVHTGDKADVEGVAVRAVPLLMSDVDTTAEMVRAAFDLGGVEVPA
ncbi:Lactyl (2) diphospho-(5')guanosine:7,8-didemethyl-8-hydroxy-5- deazariboflavin 2-phospho-L-lactate transferase [Actinokineospora spheciospongiae]|uniref:Lactyl (2) diphospho-(5')guanosine:7,8-didemethyl-8-hydroxy-5-deazariboflavin 2-phospho-L-lactate transferase n=1 Tax=Actinokineospora spheciospongiae TaxID=909613 RepID=W7J098_9PSEU|nr:2-phospho-L-lactate transferase [Actinokineospora spheciospongiae]EWC62412.1 Lactyl (2) diphospho-(5')guanosine:7,8-didemethyl-8-hydroxy-5- deazariboflavin 2-phospho-L-lactate transferase [Actinokineospora spheciospongiae]PWW64579.1 LPPG:FO 2-phospho-L-lactate transferase [Actinokineospora spheciospongiae]